MFGLFCKGLHCAGCGKGIPAGLVVALIIITAVARNAGAIGNALAEMVIAAAIVVFLAVVIAAASMVALFRKAENQTILTGRWNGRGYTELTNYGIPAAVPEWPNRPAIQNPVTIPAEWIAEERRADIPR